MDLIALCYLMAASLTGVGLALWRESYCELVIQWGVCIAVLALL